ncbi:MAG: hypothetical protein K2K70_11465 [Lachnospiraceae bacterium]|nr:hypothetical protein [Lachnospiraceae bacterium]
MNWQDLLWKNEIHSDIKFAKEMKTVYDLSYFLIDFQAIVNNMSEIIYDDINGKNQIIAERTDFDNEVIGKNALIDHKKLSTKRIENEHPGWQKEIEKNIESLLFQPPEAVANHLPGAATGLKQTTNRNYNKKHQMNLQLKGFSKGSLILDIASSLIVSLITEFIKSLVAEKTGHENIVNINIKNNYILIDDSVIKTIPKNSCMAKAVRLKPVVNQSELDIKKCIHDIVEAAKPDQNIEESVKRFLTELQKNGFVSEMAVYDPRGIKTAVRDIDRFVGSIMDVKI